MSAELRCRVHPRCPWKTMAEAVVADAERDEHEAEHEPRPVPYGDPGPSPWWHYDAPAEPRVVDARRINLGIRGR